MLENRHVTLYVTGSIASYKALALTRLFVKEGAEVRVVMTQAAQEFVTPLSFQVLSKHPVLTDPFAGENPAVVEHIELADWTEVAVIAPASANLLGKLANGIADDMASLTLMATTAPIIAAPAMNEHMLNSAAMTRNLVTLKQDGVMMIEPTTGFLAEGYSGQGRMAEPEVILAAVAQFGDARSSSLRSSSLQGKKILVTAGGTHEPIDPVRFIGNRSSGKMGYAIATIMAQRGAEVTLISGPSQLTPPANVALISVETTAEMHAAVMKVFPETDGLIMAAAVADFQATAVADHKIKKTSENDRLTVDLVKTTDILKAVAEVKQPHQFTVGFAAETNDLMQNATKKLNEKRLDLIVANDVSKPGVGFNGDTNQVTFLKPDGEPNKTPLTTKTEIANLLGDEVEELVNQKEG